jgi:glycosyltransferase involved in cell wall biosynthesis
MPTYAKRRAFLPQATRLFQKQTYTPTELVIVDDSPAWAGSCEAVLYSENVQYVQIMSDVDVTIGAKRNLACSVAQGEIICFFDDDDYFAPERLARQAEPIIRGEADVVGLTMRLVLDVQQGRLWRCSDELHARLFPHGVKCGTLMYSAKVARETVWYPNMSRGEDAWFLHRLLKHGARLVAVDDPTLYVCVRHGGNVTSDFSYGPPGWEEVNMDEYLSQEDIAFYTQLREGANV